jgi:N-acyl-D-aspartate/D-glutamate deacylase
MRRAALLAFLLAPIAVTVHCSQGQKSTSAAYDLVISNGRIIDPESQTDAIRNVGIKGGQIREIAGEPLSGAVTIDASGLVVAPGFIDLDSHAHLARFSVHDGVTTALDILRGASDVSRWYEQNQKILINLGVGVGYSLVREDVMGQTGRFDQEKLSHASQSELAEILRRVGRGLDEGAVGVGMGSSLRFSPPTWELLETLRIAAPRNAFVVTTVRDAIWETTDVPAILSEIIGAAAISGAAIHIPHLGSSGGPHVPRMLAMIDGARLRGLDVTVEIYPYTAAVAQLGPTDFDLSDALLQDTEVIATGERLNRKNFKDYTAARAFVIIHNSWIEPFVIEAIKSPVTSIASHGYLDEQGRGHPRTAGTFSRILGRYVREQKTLSLVDAIRKMTLMPARRLEARVPSMRRKGRIQRGADADIVVFDANQINDRATLKDPTLAPAGIWHVLVNGTPVVRDGVIQEGVYPGQPVRASH